LSSNHQGLSYSQYVFICVLLIGFSIGVPWSVGVEPEASHRSLGAPSPFVLHLLPLISYRVWLMSDSQCGASVVALWLRHHRPFATRLEHETACTKVITELQDSVRVGKPHADAAPYADSVPSWKEASIEKYVLSLKPTSWWNDVMWPVVAQFYGCTVNLFMLGSDANSTIEVTYCFHCYLFLLPFVLLIFWWSLWSLCYYDTYCITHLFVHFWLLAGTI
jgi:hypothetical protein